MHIMIKASFYIFLLGGVVIWPSISFTESFNFPNFSNTTTLGTPNGSASVLSNMLQLTSSISEAGSVYYGTPVSLPANKAFSTAFTVIFSNLCPACSAPKGADGFAFILQNDPRRLTALGGGGGNLGHAGTVANRILSSIGARFEVYNQQYTIYGINGGGTQGNIAALTGQTALQTAQTWYVWVDYDGTTFEMRVSSSDNRPSSPTLSAVVNLNSSYLESTGSQSPSQVYVGFTGATGPTKYMTSQVVRWRFLEQYWPLETSKFPVLSATTALSVYDPSNQNLKAIPDNRIVSTTRVTNSGGQFGPPIPNTIDNVVAVPQNVKFEVGSIAFQDGSGSNATGLTCCSSIAYSTDNSAPYTWTYTPISPYDSNVRAVKVIPSGTMNSGHVTPVFYDISFRGMIE